MINNIQAIIKKLGEEGCFFLCYLSIAEEFLGKGINIQWALETAIEHEDIYFNFNNMEDPKNFYVLYPSLLIKHISGLSVSVKKEFERKIETSQCKRINVYAVTNKGKTRFHAERDNFQPLEVSQTVLKGKIDSYRMVFLEK